MQQNTYFVQGKYLCYCNKYCYKLELIVNTIVSYHTYFIIEGVNSNVNPPAVSHSLFKEVAGKYCIQIENTKYFTARTTDGYFGVSDQCGKCEQWIIEDHYGKVSGFKQ